MHDLNTPYGRKSLMRERGYLVGEAGRFFGYNSTWFHELLSRRERRNYLHCALNGLPVKERSAPLPSLVMSAQTIQELMRSKGWGIFDLADYWGFHRTHVRELVKNEQRSCFVTCAFLGLPKRQDVLLERSLRHKRTPAHLVKAKSKQLRLSEILVVGDTYCAESSKFVEEGSCWVIQSATFALDGKSAMVELELQGDSDERLELTSSELLCWFAHVDL